MNKPELDLMVADAEPNKLTMYVVTEIVAIMLHDKISPTNYLTLTPEQRNNSRRRATALVKEAQGFWESEIRKAQAPQ